MKIKKMKVIVLAVFCLAMAAAMPAAAQQAPDWAVGTFTARNPQTGGTIVLTIDRNGSVTANLDGSLNYGNINGNTLTLNGVASRVRRNGSGIRTTRIDNGERIDYVRGGNAGGGGGVPDWAIGTFTARNPQSGGTIVLTIDGNGNATANLDGTINNGSYNNGRLTINGITSNVRSQGNGIRTTRIDNGERIDYIRGGNSGGGNVGNVPDWAIGTFTARNPQDGTTIVLTIDRNGNVSANVDGSLNNGTIYEDRLTINGVTSRVQRNGSGIRTTRLDNGERINYRRR